MTILYFRCSAALGGLAALALAALALPAQATFPGSNGLITFSAVTGSVSQIFTIRPDGRDLNQVTYGDADAIAPDLSPDGSTIAFELDEPTQCDIMLVDVDGSNLRTFASAPNVCDANPSYVPDKPAIVFESNDFATGSDAIWIKNLDGTGLQMITDGTGHGVTDPNVSPDGQTLSFRCFNTKRYGGALCSTEMDGSHLQRLTPYYADVEYKHDWAPDGSVIAFSEHCDQFHRFCNVVTIRPDGTDLHKLTHYRSVNVRALFGSYSPDGKWIVFRVDDHGQHALYRMHPDGTSVRTIIPQGDFYPRSIDWGPATG
jgi:Tol biopolymer transport system component